MEIERSVVCNKPQWAVRRRVFGTFKGRRWSMVLLKSATLSRVSRHKGGLLNTRLHLGEEIDVFLRCHRDNEIFIS